jgi:trimeric autotransporter adhesin
MAGLWGQRRRCEEGASGGEAAAPARHHEAASMTTGRRPQQLNHHHRRRQQQRRSAAAPSRLAITALALTVLLNAVLAPAAATAASAPTRGGAGARRRLHQQQQQASSSSATTEALSLSEQQSRPLPVPAGRIAQCTIWADAPSPSSSLTSTALPPYDQPPPACAVSPAYASLALERYDEDGDEGDAAAALLARGLRCAAASGGSAAACAAAADLCAWREADRRCILRADALLAVQQRCARPRYQRALAKLQQCMAAGAGSQRCQCRTPAECASAAAAAAAGGGGPGGGGAQQQQEGCRSLLGCWLTAALGSRVDVTRLVQATSVQVLPQLDAVAAVAAVSSSSSAAAVGANDAAATLAALAAANSTAAGGGGSRRRILLQTALSMMSAGGAPPQHHQRMPQQLAAARPSASSGLRRAAPSVGQSPPFTDVTGASRPATTLAPIAVSVDGSGSGLGSGIGSGVAAASADPGQALLAAALNGGGGGSNLLAAERPASMRDPLSADGSGMQPESGRLVQESGSLNGPSSQAIVPEDLFFGGGGENGGGGGGGAFLPPLPSDADVGVGGTAPPSFWTCVGMPAPPAAAAAGASGNSTSAASSPAEVLARFILADDAASGGPASAAAATGGAAAATAAAPLLVALSRGAKALSCLEQEQGGGPSGAAAERPAEQAAAQLARAFSASQERYAAYFADEQEGEEQQRPAEAEAEAALRAVVDSALPDPLAKLQQRGSSAAAAAAATASAASAAGSASQAASQAGVDVLLRAQALVADLMWSAREARFLLPREGQQQQQQQGGSGPASAVAAAGGGAAASDAVLVASARYAATMARHASAWLFRERFGGGRAAELPPRLPVTPAGAAGEAALAGLAAPYLSSLGVFPATDGGWAQVRAMSGRAMHAATSPAWLAAAAGAAADEASSTDAAASAAASLVALAAAADGLAAAHVADFWGRRFDSLRASAAPAARALALADRSTEPSWAALVAGQADAVAGLVALASGAGGGGGSSSDAAAAVAARQAAVASGLRRLVAAVPENQLPREVPQGGLDAQLLASAVDIAASAARCYGGRSGGGNDAAKQQPQDAAACAALQDATDVVLLRALGLDRSDPLYPQLRGDLATQWRCGGRGGAVAECTADPACAVTVLPGGGGAAGAAAAGSSSSDKARSASSSNPPMMSMQVCEAARVALSMGSGPEAARAAVAVSPSCAAVLSVPACDAPPLSASASACQAAGPHCRWVDGAAGGDVAGRAYFAAGEVGPAAAFGGVGGVGAVSGGAGRRSAAQQARNNANSTTPTVGSCVSNWSPLVELLEPLATQQLSAARAQCAERAGAGAEACSALQADASTLGRRRGAGAAPSLRLWLPALLVGLVLLLCGAAGGGWWLWRAPPHRPS